jgi:hypothetical protein
MKLVHYPAITNAPSDAGTDVIHPATLGITWADHRDGPLGCRGETRGQTTGALPQLPAM